ncbi:hypothetical protein [Carboxydothermus islandicus]|uniref:hypothetical protein n=1 Tax=Carboxydothermus islandicus TaxID=661089 RepID=UPI00096A7A5C|nr:hypothetical protein [Carboxydothermus islandicus]
MFKVNNTVGVYIPVETNVNFSGYVAIIDPVKFNIVTTNGILINKEKDNLNRTMIYKDGEVILNGFMTDDGKYLDGWFIKDGKKEKLVNLNNQNANKITITGYSFWDCMFKCTAIPYFILEILRYLCELVCQTSCTSLCYTCLTVNGIAYFTILKACYLKCVSCPL